MSMIQKGLQIMLKILHKLFPLFDHLYIYQVLEYNSLDFLKWFINNPLKRNLQKKHKLKWTIKTKLLFFVSLSLIILDSISSSIYFFNTLSFTIIFILIKSLYSPIFLVISQILIWPLEYSQRQKIINQTSEKLKGLPNLKVVAITGSYGKTSTKEILYTLLFKKFYVVKTPKSFNTPLGIAETILSLVKKNTDIFICEVGAYKVGEIANIARLIQPEIGIITAVAPQHLERFGSIENIAKAKFELAENLKKDGLAILNGDYNLLTEKASAVSNVILYGRDSDLYHVSNIKVEIDGTSFTLHTPKGETDVQIPLIGEHHATNFLAASIAALEVGLTLSEIKERAKQLQPTPHRLEIRKMGQITLIDNSYNINPESSESSLNLLSTFKDVRRIVITPGFVELGKQSGEENIELGKNIACIADEVIIVGENNKRQILEGIKQVGTEEFTHFVSSTKDAMVLADKIATEIIQRIARHDTEVVILLEGDLPDQYN